MPENEPWTPAEVTRGITSVFATLERIEKKLDNRPSWEDTSRAAAAQKRVDDNQDGAIKTVEDRLNRLIFLALGSAVASAGSIMVTVATAGG